MRFVHFLRHNPPELLYFPMHTDGTQDKYLNRYCIATHFINYCQSLFLIALLT